MQHLGSWQWSNYGGEHIDHGKDDETWATAAGSTAGADWSDVVNGDAVLGTRVVSPEHLESIGVVEKIAAVSVTPCGGPVPSAPTAGACYVVKMEKLLNGWLDVAKLPAAAGANVTFQYSSDAKQTLQWNAMDTVTTSASATGFKNRFNWHEFQYITVTGSLNAAPLAVDFVGLRLMNKMPKVGSFTSSNDMLNKVYDGHVATNEGLTIGGMFVDCPNRERFGYGGDSQTHIEFALATYAAAPFFAKWSRDWADAGVGNGKGGADDGSLPNSAPTYQGSGGPAWGLISVKLPWELFLQSGDLRALNASYYTTKRFLALLTKSVDETTGIFNTGGRMLADWQSVSSYAEIEDAQILFNSAYLVYQLKLAARTATALGETDDAKTYASTAQTISAGVHATYYDAASKSYFARNGHANVSYQGFNVVALMAGLVPSAGGVEDDVLAMLEHQITVEKSGHLDTGLFNTYLMATLLSSPRGSAQKRRDDLLLTMATTPTYPGYGWLVTQGLGTWPETWKIGSVAGGASLIHGCMNGFGLWFPQGILGVRADPDFPGFSRFAVRPAFGINITQAEGKVATPHGAVSVSWTTPSATATTLKLVVPFNTVATVWLPATAASAVSEGGKPATSSATFVRQDGADTVWEVGSGEYAFATVTNS
jgi:alpha-L-rhamnosidase